MCPSPKLDQSLDNTHTAHNRHGWRAIDMTICLPAIVEAEGRLSCASCDHLIVALYLCAHSPPQTTHQHEHHHQRIISMQVQSNRHDCRIHANPEETCLARTLEVMCVSTKQDRRATTQHAAAPKLSLGWTPAQIHVELNCSPHRTLCIFVMLIRSPKASEMSRSEGYTNLRM